MTFKYHTMGAIEDRKLSEHLEAEFHKRLRCLVPKKQQGYIMQQFREVIEMHRDNIDNLDKPLRR